LLKLAQVIEQHWTAWLSEQAALSQSWHRFEKKTELGRRSCPPITASKKCADAVAILGRVRHRHGDAGAARRINP